VIPEQFLAAATAKRAELIETLAEVDDEIADAWLEEREISGLEIAVRTTYPFAMTSTDGMTPADCHSTSNDRS
jgi:hypothetical protein